MASGFREEKNTAGTGFAGKKSRARSVRRPASGKGGGLFSRMRGLKPRLPYWMRWYDLVMTPLLILAAVMTARNIQDVLLFFLWLTVRLLDAALVVGLIAIVILVILLLTGRGRRRRERWSRW